MFTKINFDLCSELANSCSLFLWERYKTSSVVAYLYSLMLYSNNGCLFMCAICFVGPYSVICVFLVVYIWTFVCFLFAVYSINSLLGATWDLVSCKLINHWSLDNLPSLIFCSFLFKLWSIVTYCWAILSLIWF